MIGAAERTSLALEPLRATLLAAAQAEVRQIEASTEQEISELLDEARRRREAVLGEARARGAADGAMRLQAEMARARREAGGRVLAARREAYDELRRQAGVAVRRLLQDPEERSRLSADLRGRLGEAATIRSHPDGGLVGRGPDGRTIDASVPALVDAALAVLDLEPIWTRP